MGVFGDIGHGFEQGANWALDKGEKLADAGKKMAGEGIDWGAHKLGGALDAAGLHSAADKVEDWGDEIAADLGAMPGERQLGESDDPKDLVHGDHDKIVQTAGHLKKFFTAFEKVSAGLKKVDSSGWKGEGGDAFRDKLGAHPAKWLHAADACETASKALEAYAETVKWAQEQAEEAIALYRHGKETSESAISAYRKRVDAYKAKIEADEDPGPVPEPFRDPGKADIEAAREKLAEARRQRNTAAATADSRLKAALAHAPAEPPPLDRLGNDVLDREQARQTELLHLAGGVLKGTAELVNFARGVNPMDAYNLTHPAEFLQGVSMTLSGLTSTAAHPERAVKAAVDDFEKDPSEFSGRFLPQALGTDGAGLAAGGLKAAATAGLKDAATAGLKDAAEQAAVKESSAVAEKSAADVAKSNPEKYDTPNPSEKVKDDPTDPVDLTTGRMYLHQTDVVLPGVLPLVIKRRVESGYRFGRWFGPSWYSTVDQRLEIDSENVVLVSEDGLLLVYPHPSPGEPSLPSHGPRRPLERVDGGYTVTDPQQGWVKHFGDRGEGLAVLEQIDDRNGNWITFEYDADGTPLGIVSSTGHDVRITTQDGRITALHLGGTGQELKRYGYTDGNLTEVVNSSGLPLRFTYDEAGRVTSWTDTNDRTYTYTYDDQDRCIAEGGSAGHMALRLAYDETDPATGLRVTTATTAEGHTRRYLINERAQVVAETDPLGAVTRYRRDRYNRLLAETDPLGHTTSYRYDEAGNLLSVTRPDGREARAEYNALGLPVKITGPDGATWRQTYDDRGNRTSATDPAGQTTRFSYDEAGRLTAVTDPLGHTTTVECDRAGLPVRITDPLGSTTTYERDAFGRPTAITDPTGAVTRLEWSLEGHLTRRTAPDGTSESWTYDGEGNCTSHTDPLGGVTRFEYTHFDLLAARTDPDGVRYEFAHDCELRLTQVTNPQGLTWSYVYDPAGRLVSETDFDDRTLTYTYDSAGRLSSRTDALGQTIRFDRNELGQVVRKDADGQVTTYAYDFTGALAEARGPHGSTLTILRDRYGRVRSETVDGRTLTYAYDTLGRRTGRTTPTGATTTWSYDAAGRRTAMVASGRAIDSAYDRAGRELTRHIGGTVTLEHTFDALGRLTTQSVTGVGGQTLQHRAYTYRADGNVIRVTDRLTGTRRFDLDATGRVTAVHAANWTETYAYDEAGNQTHASWPPDHPGVEATGPRSYQGTCITRAGKVRYEHDALGRVTLRQKTRLSRKPDTWRYEWDAEDRLTSVTTPDGTRWRYTYDPLGRRTAKLRLAPDGETVVERVDFTWDGTTLCEQTTTSAALPNPVTLTWDHQGLRPVSQTERITAADASQEEIDSRFFAIVTDLVGTPTELVDEQGHIAWRTRSTLWGTTAWATDSTTYTPLRFPGQYYDPETGLHYNYFRHYDPATARYLSPDPLGLAPAPNPAAYVRNPFTWADPLGLAPDYPKGEKGNPFDKREEAERSAFEVAGVPYGTAPDAEWIVMGDKTLRHMPGHVYSSDATHWGNFRQFETENGSRVVVEHTHDPAGPHFHAGAPKGFTAEDRARNGVNFGWDNTERGYGTMERYRALNKPGGDHHFFYKK
ncbi:putative T7SS-secreted protein [Streptomyces mexicanus]|uniref:RHS domain-containing protein n=1 Tax=Streptomyces mexicanus TaxID=178566 RepID=A0A7X1LQ36_9ACTN|nr:RHS repeat-associated core domain-containing protein [Streptomyces mexicanus]MBC2864071.1 RHS domain-containing protein [Streptomyces mexicanus]